MTNTPDIGAVIADLAYATEALAEIRAIALQALGHTAPAAAVHDPLLDIVNAASYGLRLHPKETPCSTR
jgi:hypothetical protein